MIPPSVLYSDLGMDQVQWMQSPENITIPEEGDIPVELCLHPNFPLTNDVNLKPRDVSSSHSHPECRTTTAQRNGKRLQPWAYDGL
ncbi:MAG: hypothetical protein ACJZ59_07820 [Candidatus Thalassarchaeaceae archaeon]